MPTESAHKALAILRDAVLRFRGIFSTCRRRPDLGICLVEYASTLADHYFRLFALFPGVPLGFRYESDEEINHHCVHDFCCRHAGFGSVCGNFEVDLKIGKVKVEEVLNGRFI